MKKLVVLALTFLFIGIATYARMPSYDVFWILEEDQYVVTSPNALLYKTAYYEKEKYNRWIAEDSKKTSWVGVTPENRWRKTIDYTVYDTKTLKKPQSIKVRGYANLKEQLDYDTYVVEYKEILYYLPVKYVQDNSLIDAHNAALTKRYTDMFDELNSLATERDSLIRHYAEVCRTKTNYYLEQISTLPSVIDSVENAVKHRYSEYRTIELEKWFKSLPSSTQKIYNNVIELTSADLHSPNSAGGCDCSVYFINKSKKTIKYFYWTGSFYNAVNDPVFCDIRGYSSFTGTETGPIESGEYGGGVWDCVIYDWAAEYVKLSNISIVYLDGSRTSIGASDIKRLLTYSTVNENLSTYGSEYDAIKREKAPYESLLREANSEYDMWKSRLYWLEQPPVSSAGYEENYYTPMKKEKGGEFKVLFDRLYSIYHRRDRLKESIEKFEERNFIKK